MALLKQAFPNLTAAQLVEILLESARDAGAAGTDSTYGRGILDIARAFQPIGATTLADGITKLRIGETSAVGSRAMGDALNGGPRIDTVITDRYDRAFGYDLARGMRSAATLDNRLEAALTPRGIRRSAGNDALSMAFTIADRAEDARRNIAQPLRLSQEEAEGARVLAGRIAARLSPDTHFALALSEGASGVTAQLQGASRPAFLIAQDPLGDSGFAGSPDVSVALRRQLGPWGLTASAETGEVWLGDMRFAQALATPDPERYAQRSFAIAADRDWGPIATTLGLTWMEEERTVLGGYFAEPLGAGGADTLFLDASARLALPDRWDIGMAFRQGYTRPWRRGAIAEGSALWSNGWSLDFGRTGMAVPGDRIGFRLSQPLRVAAGGIDLSLPVDYDYATQSATYGIRQLSLSPTGREVTGELRWSAPVLGGDAGASLYHRSQPGHRAQAPGDTGVAVSFQKRF